MLKLKSRKDKIAPRTLVLVVYPDAQGLAGCAAVGALVGPVRRVGKVVLAPAAFKHGTLRYHIVMGALGASIVHCILFEFYYFNAWTPESFENGVIVPFERVVGIFFHFLLLHHVSLQ